MLSVSVTTETSQHFLKLDSQCTDSLPVDLTSGQSKLFVASEKKNAKVIKPARCSIIVCSVFFFYILGIKLL